MSRILQICILGLITFDNCRLRICNQTYWYVKLEPHRFHEFFLLLIFENFWNCANFYWTFFLWFFFNFRTTNLVKCQRLIFNQIYKLAKIIRLQKSSNWLNSFCQSIRDTVLERRLISNMYYESKDKEPQSEKSLCTVCEIPDLSLSFYIKW